MYPTTLSRTSTYTKIDIRRVWEYFRADALMLARRTQAQDVLTVESSCTDVLLMVSAKCISNVHIQLIDRSGRCVRAHEYKIHENVNWTAQRPSDNRWPCLPDGQLVIIVEICNQTVYDQLLQSNQFQIGWGSSSLSTNYSNMMITGERKYASNSYGWQRNSFSAF